MSDKVVKVTLRREKKVLSEIQLAPGSEPVLVGRARECTLRIPADDFSASGVHAKIFWKGGSLMIEDAGSRNGIYCDGAPLKKATKLRLNSYYAVGGCLLEAKAVSAKRETAHSAHHRLEFLNGKFAGKIVEVKPHPDGKDFDIGLDPACSVHLSDMLVSRRHAVLRMQENGECWIEDTGSRNGTYVNGEQLTGKSRLLKDGDTISIAFFEFRFLDRGIAHTRIQAWLKLAVISVTVCVMAALYVAWTASRKSVENYLVIARQAAAVEDFVRAQEAIEMSRNARDVAEYREQIEDLLMRVHLWERTCATWAKVRKDIEGQFLTRARLAIDDLLTGPLESWTWNPDQAQAVKKDVEFAAKALRLYFSGKDVIAVAVKDVKADADLPVRAAIGPLEAFLHESASVSAQRTYMTKVMKLLQDLLAELQVIRSGYNDIDASIAKISEKAPNFQQIFAGFDRISRNERLPGAVRSYARQQLAPCAAFVKTQDYLKKEKNLLLKMDFVGVRRMDSEFRLPSQELCIRHVKYSDARAALDEQHKQYQHESVSLQQMTEGLLKAGVTIDSRGENLEYFFNTTNLTRALEFDCLSRRPPNMRRQQPVGLYDTLFGIEATYESLLALPKNYSGRNLRSLGFEPKCFKARRALDCAETFVKYLDGADRRYLQNGDIGRYFTHCVRITREREQLVNWLKDVKGTERAEIVAAFYADFFSSEPQETAKRILASRFGKLKKSVIELSERYQLETDPVKQLKVRDEILARGIPGDPVLHSKWAQKYD